MMELNKLLFSVLLIGSYNSITTVTAVDTDISIDVFASKLYNVLAKDEGNVIFSPFSVHDLLSLVYQGAAGPTAQAIERALFISNREEVATGYKDLWKEIMLERSVLLNIANKLFVQKQYPLKKEFVKIAEEKFVSEVENVDFAQHDVTAQLINDWVRTQTNKKIEFNVNPNLFDYLTRLVAVSGVYFVGDWQSQFDPKLTRESSFYLSETETVKTSVMTRVATFKYRDDLYMDAEILSIPYKSESMSLIIILPKKHMGIKDVEAKLQGKTLTYLCQDLYDKKLDLFLPKFKLEAKFNLNDSATTLGMDVLFSKSANFSGIVDSPEDFFVSQFVQKVAIDVDELGTEAAGASEIDIEDADNKAKAKLFNVNHPFIFALTYNKSGTQIPLIMGRYSKPN